MRFTLYTLVLVLVFSSSAIAQKKKTIYKKTNGYAAYTTQKKLSKQWIKVRQNSLPVVAFSIGGTAGFNNVQTEETGVNLLAPFSSLTPQFQFNFNPNIHYGVHMGFQLRNQSIFYTTAGEFTNGNVTAIANGYWENQNTNVGVNLGLSLYKSVSKKLMSCTGFKIIKAQTVHFYADLGLIYAPSIISEVRFRGNYTTYSGGEELRDTAHTDIGVMIGENGRRSNTQLMFYAEPGIRFSNGTYATKIGPMIEMQLNENLGLVNDFTSRTYRNFVYGLHISFEFF